MQQGTTLEITETPSVPRGKPQLHIVGTLSMSLRQILLVGQKGLFICSFKRPVIVLEVQEPTVAIRRGGGARRGIACPPPDGSVCDWAPSWVHNTTVLSGHGRINSHCGALLHGRKSVEILGMRDAWLVPHI